MGGSSIDSLFEPSDVSPPPVSSHTADLAARPTISSEYLEQDEDIPRFHCHLCKELVPANYFFWYARLCRHCCRCRGQTEFIPLETDIRPNLEELEEREKRFQAGDFLKALRSYENSSAKRKAVSDMPRLQRVIRRSYRLRGEDDSMEEDTTAEESDDMEDDAQSLSYSQSQNERRPDQNSKASSNPLSNDDAMKMLVALSNDVSALRKGFASQTETDQNETSTRTAGKEAGSRTSSSTSKALESYPWIAPDIVQLVGRDQLKPEQLTGLRHPSSKVVKKGQILSTPTSKPPGNFTPEWEDPELVAFLHAVPDVRAFAQLWLTYVDIRGLFDVEYAYLSAYQAFLRRILDLDSLYSWKQGLCQYVLTVCNLRFGTATPEEWRKDDLACSNDFFRYNARIDTRRYTESSVDSVWPVDQHT